MTSKLKTSVLGGATLFITLALSVSGPSVSAAEEAHDVKAANKQFYVALNSVFKGDVEPMKKIWSHDKDVTYMGPDGTYERGWEAVIGNWTKQSTEKFGGHVDLADVVVNSGKEIAVVSGIEKGQNGESKPVAIRATNIFQSENGTWKMIGHHTDKLPWVK